MEFLATGYPDAALHVHQQALPLCSGVITQHKAHYLLLLYIWLKQNLAAEASLEESQEAITQRK